ncbi:MAG: nucleoside-triphosphatase [Candidatus Kapaibacterium sp.]
MRAAVLGSIWASIEIIVGNFLHGFRMPFTGEILTFFAIYFLTAASVRWKLKGLIWRAGLICAMMKFFTPGIKVFGPIIGIISESFMFEIVLRILGMNAVGFIIGGGLTLCLPLIHKLVNLLILYGWNLVVVFDKSIEFIFKLINIENTDSLVVLLVLLSINFMFGGIAATLGYRSGKKQTDFIGNKMNTAYVKPEDNIQKKEDIKIIFLNLAANTAIIIMLLLFLKDNLLLCSVLTLIFICYVLFKYKNSRRIFRNYKLWLQILVFTALTTAVLSTVMKTSFDKSVLTGIEMFVRVLLITIGFYSISSEISKTSFTDFLRGKLNRNFSEALNLAFAAVPEIINTSRGITSILNPGKFINELTYLTDVWHERFKSMSNKIIIITGSQGIGKTTYLEGIIDNKTIGVFSKVVYENNVRIGYDALNINSNEILPLCRVDYKSDVMLGKFGFYRDTFSLIMEKIMSTKKGTYESIIIDEIGLLEKDKMGWYDLMKWAVAERNIKIVLSVRKDVMKEIQEELEGREWEVVDLDLRTGIDKSAH